MNVPGPPFDKTEDPALLGRALKRVRALCAGNGLKADSITVESSALEVRHAQAATYLELKPRQSEKRVNGKQSIGTVVQSKADMQRRIDKTILDSIGQPSKRSALLKHLLDRDDSGFGLKQKSFAISDISEDYSWSENCTTCHGQGKTACPRCNGLRQEKCPQCHGATTITCPACRGSGQITGANGQMQTCTKCQGRGQIRCTLCHGTGKITCRQCKGTGYAICTSCGGTGWHTHVVHLSVQADPHFEFDRKHLPKGLIETLDRAPQKLTESETVKISSAPIEDDPNTLGVLYDLKFPAGEISFSLKGKKTIKANLYGYDAQLSDMSPFLEKITAPGLARLQAAAQGKGNVSENIRLASKYRLIGQALLMGAQKSVRETAAALHQKFGLGLQAKTAKVIAKNADQAMALITRKPRYTGLALGLVLVAAFYGSYYLGPLRGLIAPHIPDENLHILIDLIIIFIGGTITTLSIQLTAKRALQNALGHLVNANQKKKLMPKTRSSGWWGYAGGAIVYLIMIELTVHIGASATPHWYTALRGILGL